jgi:hypothetical protein
VASLIIQMVFLSETKVGIMAGCGGSYELGCRGSLALVNEEGEASGACLGGACADGACVDGACADGACVDGACADGACVGGACVDGACADGACADGAVVVFG